MATSETYYRRSTRTVAYLSAEFLLGPHLANNPLNLRSLAEVPLREDRVRIVVRADADARSAGKTIQIERAIIYGPTAR